MDNQHAALTACPNCDLLLREKLIYKGKKLTCPRCGSELWGSQVGNLNTCLMYALSGLILFFPAISLPIMTFEFAGQADSNTMIQGVMALYDQNYYWLAFMVFACSIFVPLLQLLLIIFVISCTTFGWFLGAVATALKIQHFINEWELLEVYMLAILVGYIKMMALGSLEGGLGLYAFVGLLLCTRVANIGFAPSHVWQLLRFRTTRQIAFSAPSGSGGGKGQ